MSPETPSNPVLNVLKRLPITMVLSDLTTGRIVWASTPEPAIIGVTSAADVIGKCLLDFIDASQQSIALRDLQAVAAGESPPPVTYHIRRVGGGRSDVQISSIPTNLDGRPAMLSLVTDVTAGERARRDLDEARERYQQLVETSPDGIVVVGPHGIAFANETIVRALGAESSADLVGQPMYRFIHPDFHDAVREARRVVVRYGKTIPAAPVTLIRLDGACVRTTAQTTRVHWSGEPASQTIMRDLAATACEAAEADLAVELPDAAG
ncbi:MAG: PAS domain S-box protein [Coriobacteriia bacterium]|nr:PAS domain S-box protein [Coriobacteriia bacterium]